MNTELSREKNYFMNFTVVTYFLSTRSVLSPIDGLQWAWIDCEWAQTTSHVQALVSWR
jgi:hypothetical protein